jgi:hypothetical protein
VIGHIAHPPVNAVAGHADNALYTLALAIPNWRAIAAGPSPDW